MNLSALVRMSLICVLFFLSNQVSVAQTDFGVKVSRGVSLDAQNGPANRKIVVDSLVISGTQSIERGELEEISNSVIGAQFDEDKEGVEDQILSKFQDRGYFQAVVDNLEIKVLDPLASPKPARLEAQVTEGPLCHLGAIEFLNNRAFSSAKLRAKYPIKDGEVFKRSKIAGGSVALRKVYSSRGFLDASFVPDVLFGSMVNLKIHVSEGPQYRMGSFEVVGPPELAEKLQARWKLHPGTVFNRDYVETFVDKNHSLLGADFTIDNGVALIEDCPAATVFVHLHLKNDPQHEVLDSQKRVTCPNKDED
ncbi:MAG: POTRA domain-containing protein [Terriglobales bacterium]